MTSPCPRCGADVPATPGYASWCDRCDWNLSAPETPPTPGRVGRLYDAAGRRAGDRMASEMAQSDRLRARTTPTRLAAFALAGLYHASVAALVVGAVSLAVLAFPNPFALFVAVVLLGIAAVMRPRLGRVPREGVVAREEAPELHGLVDAVARELGVRVDVVVLDDAFNAAWAVLGLRRRHVLTLGVPFFTVLGPTERVALVAHELAHARNGDAQRGLVVGSAVNGLAELYALLAPDADGREWSLGGLDPIANVMGWVLSRPVLALLLLELHLLARDSQRAEYLADRLAAQTAGTRATVSLHEQLLLDTFFDAAFKRAAADRAAPAEDVLLELRDRLTLVPGRELERRRRAARLAGARLGDTHPPTARRIEVLESRPVTEPRVTLTGARSRTIDAELADRRVEVTRELLDQYREALYG